MRPSQKIDEDLVVICNVNIHVEAKLSRDDFLNRIKDVKEIRCREESSYASYYITSVLEFKRLKLFYDLINNGEFPIEEKHFYWFAVAINPNLYDWFKSTSFNLIERQIIFWMASIYFFDPEKRDKVFDKQFYPPIIDEVKVIIKNVYEKVAPFKYTKETEIASTHDLDKDQFEFYPEELYYKASRIYCGFDPPEFLSNPFGYSNDNEYWGIKRFNFAFIEAYLTESDWENIIINKEYDTLNRAESRKDLWNKWKHTFAMYELTKKTVYSFFLFGDSNLNKSKLNLVSKKGKNEGFVYLMRNPIFEKGIYKIGLTRKNIEIREKGLSNTSVPDQFYTMCEWFVNDCVKAENRIKSALAKYIVDKKREFYKLNHRLALKIIEKELEKLESEN